MIADKALNDPEIIQLVIEQYFDKPGNKESGGVDILPEKGTEIEVEEPKEKNKLPDNTEENAIDRTGKKPDIPNPPAPVSPSY